MKIAFIGGRNIHKLGGIENYMFNLCTKLVERGIEPIVYCESDRDYEETINGFKVIHWKSPRSVYLCKIFLGLKSTLNALFKQKDVVIFHYNAWPPSIWNWIPRLFGKKSILMGHGLEWKRTKYSPKQQKIMRIMERVSAIINNHLVMVSQEQSDWYASQYGKKCATIPTAVNLPASFTDTAILETYGLKKNGYYLYLGRLVQDKNPDYLIKAFNKANPSNSKLVIAGSNDSDPEYVDYLHKLAKGNHDIIFTGAVYGLDKETLLKNCKVFCIPSTIEGLAITLLEAMSYAKPVIASDIEANKEGLGDNGIWVKAENEDELSNAILYCESNIGILEEEAKKNYNRIETLFTWDRISLLYSDYTNNIINKR
ncbi:MAG: glycosyltransferase family 4 protein [Alistipes sp.]|nr:glycosyltransferase family 4 protein [Alistipes sp.]